MSPITDRYRRWFEYEKDAHAKVLMALHAVPAAERSSPGFQKAVDLVAHMLAARRLWLFRLGAAAVPPSELFPAGTPVESLRAGADEVEAAWDGYLAALDDGAAATFFEYQSVEGERYRNRVEDILAQLFGHSSYHRGQIALLLRSGGHEPAVTDFLFWTREPI